MVKKKLTPEEMVAVSLATKGESYGHRRWPEEAVRAFASAPVVTLRGPQRQRADGTRPALGNVTRLLRYG